MSFVLVAKAGHSFTICLAHIPGRQSGDGINLMVPSPLEMQTFLFLVNKSLLISKAARKEWGCQGRTLYFLNKDYSPFLPGKLGEGGYRGGEEAAGSPAASLFGGLAMSWESKMEQVPAPMWFAISR